MVAPDDATGRSLAPTYTALIEALEREYYEHTGRRLTEPERRCSWSILALSMSEALARVYLVNRGIYPSGLTSMGAKALRRYLETRTFAPEQRASVYSVSRNLQYWAEMLQKHCDGSGGASQEFLRWADEVGYDRIEWTRRFPQARRPSDIGEERQRACECR